MKIVALIPARAGSRRLPGKNKMVVGTKALWRHAVEHARGNCDRIVLSTNDDEIAMAALGETEPGVLIIRQPAFEQSYNVMLEVVNHADKLLQEMGYDADAICLLQPTSPLRNSHDVRSCIKLFEEHNADSVVSVTEAERDIAFQMRWAGRLEKLPEIVRPNGAVYVVRTSVLRAGGSWYGDHTYSWLMPKDRSIDVDTLIDLEMARTAWESLYGAKP